MGNPRQRRKARSSSYKPVSHSRRAKTKLKKMPPIRGPKALQEAWDSTKTVRQNYAAIGLAHTLNPCPSGGVESDVRREPIIHEEDLDSVILQEAPSIPKGYGRIIRDEEGNVTGVEIPEELGELGPDTEEMREPDIDSAVLKPWVTDLGGGKGDRSNKGGSDVIQTLERISTAVHQDGRTMSISSRSGNGNGRVAEAGIGKGGSSR